jgi:hypothetical protein
MVSAQIELSFAMKYVAKTVSSVIVLLEESRSVVTLGTADLDSGFCFSYTSRQAANH